jgi:hypothetical protein
MYMLSPSLVVWKHKQPISLVSDVFTGVPFAHRVCSEMRDYPYVCWCCTGMVNQKERSKLFRNHPVLA